MALPFKNNLLTSLGRRTKHSRANNGQQYGWADCDGPLTSTAEPAGNSCILWHVYDLETHTHYILHTHTHTSSLALLLFGDMPLWWDSAAIWGIVLISPVCVCLRPRWHSAAWEKEQMADEGSEQANTHTHTDTHNAAGGNRRRNDDQTTREELDVPVWCSEAQTCITFSIISFQVTCDRGNKATVLLNGWLSLH